MLGIWQYKQNSFFTQYKYNIPTIVLHLLIDSLELIEKIMNLYLVFESFSFELQVRQQFFAGNNFNYSRYDYLLLLSLSNDILCQIVFIIQFVSTREKRIPKQKNQWFIDMRYLLIHLYFYPAHAIFFFWLYVWKQISRLTVCCV